MVVERLHCLWNHKYVKNTGYSQTLKEQVSSNHTSHLDFGLINLKVPYNTENFLDIKLHDLFLKKKKEKKRKLHDLSHDLLTLIFFFFFFRFWYLLLFAIQYITIYLFVYF